MKLTKASRKNSKEIKIHAIVAKLTLIRLLNERININIKKVRRPLEITEILKPLNKDNASQRGSVRIVKLKQYIKKERSLTSCLFKLFNADRT